LGKAYEALGTDAKVAIVSLGSQATSKAGSVCGITTLGGPAGSASYELIIWVMLDQPESSGISESQQKITFAAKRAAGRCDGDIGRTNQGCQISGDLLASPAAEPMFGRTSTGKRSQVKYELIVGRRPVRI
jgi:hypothetical protein